MTVQFVFEHQRSATDCSICCTAMALRLPYGRVREIAGDDKGWNGSRYDDIFEALGFDVLFQPRVLRPHRPAILSVPSRLNPGGAHAVYYDAGRLYDPTVLALPYSLGAALTAANGFFQWEPLEI